MTADATGTGRAYLVGAGPGDAGLITRRGLDLLRSCDVVLHDRLVSPRLLDEVPDGAEVVFVGKSPDSPSMPQADIDAAIVKHARAGKRVVRLKGGDPVVFGRGADEAQALAAAGIPFEIVPGVTSATAVPAYAGIPVTHSGVSSSFTVLTAHESSDRPDARARWDHLALGADTLVLLMGVGSLRETCTRLVEAGRDPHEPCAVIERGTTNQQRIVAGDLESIAELAAESGIEPPAITVVGRVVKLRAALDWFSSRPLFGRRVVVTRSPADAPKLGDALVAGGAEVLYLPTIEIQDPPSWDEVDRSVRELAAGSYDWVVFSSGHGVQKLCERVGAADLDARVFGGTRIAAVGPATDRALRERGLRADLVPATFTGTAMAEALGGGPGQILLPRPVDAPGEIVDALRSNGWKVTEVAAYVTATVTPTGEAARALASGQVDAITFASASSVRNLVAAVGSSASIKGGPKIVCIGPVTAAAAEEVGLAVDAVAADHTIEGLVRAVTDCVGR